MKARYIAVEIACMLKSLGSDVTLLIRHDGPLRTFDDTISEALTEEMESQGIRIIKHCVVRILLLHLEKR
jgi:glutathione reductase (NADPH)